MGDQCDSRYAIPEDAMGECAGHHMDKIDFSPCSSGEEGIAVVPFFIDFVVQRIRRAAKGA